MIYQATSTSHVPQAANTPAPQPKPVLQPRNRAPPKLASSQAQSAKAPSSKAPSAKAPSASHVPQAASSFKPPRKRAGPLEAGPSASTGPSAATGRGTGAKRGRKKIASSQPSYSYFTCNGNF
jgi:hypothetical protein